MGLSEEERGALDRLESQLLQDDLRLAVTMAWLRGRLRARRLVPFVRVAAAMVPLAAGLAMLVIGICIGMDSFVAIGVTVLFCYALLVLTYLPFARRD
ncbi:DUF3040 domain-containing protein [Streptomyces sp. PTM05]|uniref:DUF3040 domain-containing protein n=1 Tax=Streptantibioticus parmotrematis TaxID=2873249 RepID=A0ABS7R305_9ACTN|nr:DUF3040 domain-containing protein [Streptantibioticus parmotrematis]MBY8889264.1 DUF3040 domain-containing protein [Streptantibioticus parmotrematis]